MNKESRACLFCGQTFEWGSFRPVEPQLRSAAAGMVLAVKLMDGRLDEACVDCWDTLMEKLDLDTMRALVVEQRDGIQGWREDLDVTETDLETLRAEHEKCLSEGDVSQRVESAVNENQEKAHALLRRREQELECEATAARERGFRDGKRAAEAECRFGRGSH